MEDYRLNYFLKIFLQKYKSGLVILFIILFFSLHLTQIQAFLQSNDGEDEEDEFNNIDEDYDGIDDQYEEINKRQIQFEVGATEISIESRLKSGEKQDEIHFVIKIEDEIRINMEYESDLGTSEIDLELKLKFFTLLEYLDVNLDGIFTKSIDSVVQEIAIESLDFFPISYSTLNNNSLYLFNITSINSLFSVQFYIASEFFMMNNVTNTPTQLKLDIALRNFPFVQNDTQIALGIQFEGENEYELNEETEDEKQGRSQGESEVELFQNNFTGFFSWSESLYVNDLVQKVNISALDISEEGTELYFSYPHGSKLLHDPKLGVAGILLSPPSPTEIIQQLVSLLQLPKEGYLFVMTLITLVVIAGILLFRKNKNN